MNVAILTRSQLDDSIAIFERAANVLLKEGLYGQAVARAYYALECAAEWLGYHYPEVFWPDDPRDSTRPADRFLHVAVSQIVKLAADFEASSGNKNIDPYVLQAQAAELITARFEADYRAYRPQEELLSRTRIMNAKELTKLLLKEIDRRAAGAKK